MRAFVYLRGPNGEDAELGHGDIIGRLSKAALCLDDPRVSEAHAMVSLRGDRLKLLALRGRLFVAGQATPEVDLTANLIVDLAPWAGASAPTPAGPVGTTGVRLALEVDAIFLPESVLAIEAPGLARQVLHGVVSLFVLPRPRLVPGFAPDADAVIWGDGAAWRIAAKGGAPVALVPGTMVHVAGLDLTPVEVALGQSGVLSTLGSNSALRIVASFDTAEVHSGTRVALLGGVPARILSELVAFDGPVAWEVLAREIWGEPAERETLRARFDMGLMRLRKRLREAGVREDLVVATGTGQVQILLRAGDTIDARV